MMGESLRLDILTQEERAEVIIHQHAIQDEPPEVQEALMIAKVNDLAKRHERVWAYVLARA